MQSSGLGKDAWALGGILTRKTHAFDKFSLRVGVMVIFDRKLFAGILIKAY